jgi:phage baseplate assembly protein W
MPIERVSNSFKDISMSFQVNPMNNDLIALKNETAIARSIRNLVSTNIGEVPYSSKGSNINNTLFENMTALSANVLENDIRTVIENFERRVQLISVRVDSDYDNATYNAVITYSIIGIEALPQQLTLVLDTVR